MIQSLKIMKPNIMVTASHTIMEFFMKYGIMPINISLAQGRKAYMAKLHGKVNNSFSLCAI
jgi:hypothetical protein